MTKVSIVAQRVLLIIRQARPQAINFNFKIEFAFSLRIALIDIYDNFTGVQYAHFKHTRTTVIS